MKYLTCFVLVLIVWLLLTWSVDYQQVATGVVMSVLVAAFVGDVFPQQPSRLVNPVRLFWLILYIPYFFYYCLQANLDVAYRVLHPDLPIRPGIIKVRTSLTTDMAKTFLANSITLTPGTLVVDIDGQDLYVHVINLREGFDETDARRIVNTFEPFLRKIYE